MHVFLCHKNSVLFCYFRKILGENAFYTGKVFIFFQPVKYISSLLGLFSISTEGFYVMVMTSVFEHHPPIHTKIRYLRVAILSSLPG